MTGRRGGKSRRNDDDNGWGEWGGYMAAKVRKLQKQYETDLPTYVQNQDPNLKSSIFKGVAIFVNGWTEPTSEELRHLMMLHGGVYNNYYIKKLTTHIVATNLATVKIKDSCSEKVVKPEWITDSIKAGKLLNYKDYELFKEAGKNQRTLDFLTVEKGSVIFWETPENKSLGDGKSGSSPFSTNLSAIAGNSSTAAVAITSGATSSTSSNMSAVTKKSSEYIDHPTSVVSSTSVLAAALPIKSVSTFPLPPGSLSTATVTSASNSVLSPTSTSIRLPTSNTNSTLLSTSTSFPILSSACTSTLPPTSTLIHQSTSASSSTSTHESVSTSTSTVTSNSAVNTCASSTSITRPSASFTTDPTSALCATSSAFLSEFYNNSRLHHISAMGAEFRNYVNKLQSRCDPDFPGRIRIKAWKARQRLSSKNMEKLKINNNSNVSDNIISICGDVKYKRVVMHIDMDCFFASVGIRNRPELKDKPVVVAHSRGMGSTDNNRRSASIRRLEQEYYKRKGMVNSKSKENVVQAEYVSSGEEYDEDLPEISSLSDVACCNYEARKFGLSNGISLGEAKKLCPNLRIIPYDFEGYREVAYTLYDTVASFTSNIEAVSCDELYVDCTELLNSFSISPLEFTAIVREEIFTKTGCSCSAGLAANMLLARMATRKAKPNGQYFLKEEEVDDFMARQSVNDLPGVGWSLGKRLSSMKIETCADLRTLSLDKLSDEFGPRTGRQLYNFCRGTDERELRSDHQRKSVSVDVNYGIRFTKESEVATFIGQLSNEVSQRLLNAGLKGKSLTLKLKVRKKDAPVETSKFMGHGICDNVTKTVALPVATVDCELIAHEVLRLLTSLKFPPHEMRGIGIQVQRLEPIESVSSDSTLHKYFNKKNDIRENEQRNQSADIQNVEESSRKSDKDSNIGSGAIENIGSDLFSQDNGMPLPSPSEIDFEVLAALPEDLQQQILQEYKRRGLKLDKVVSEEAEAQPGTSREAPPLLREEKKDDGVIADDAEDSPEKLKIGGNEIDRSFYDALPPDIQEEIKEAMRHEQQQALQKVAAKTPVKQQPPLAIPVLKTPPKPANNKNANNSPVRRGPKKEKRGSTAKKNSPIRPKNLYGRQQPKLDEMLTSRANNITQNNTGADGLKSVSDAVAINNNRNKEVREKKTKRASLAGITDLTGVKELIKEWIETCEELEQEDVETVSKYLQDLILERNLETVDLVVKYFYRLVSRLGKMEWKAIYCQIVEDVQKLVVHFYKAPLKLP